MNLKSLLVFIGIAASGVVQASVNVTVNGTTYPIPQTNEKGWGNNVTTWIQAISANTVQPSGGLFTLSADLDLGAAFGLKSLYYKSRSSNVAGSGILRLANTDGVGFRNAGNTGDLLLIPNATDGILNYNGVALDSVSAVQTLSNKTLTSPAINTPTVTGSGGLLTLPAGPDTLVGRNTTDTLTNKSISGASNTLSSIPNSATTATNANTASAIVARDGSGNFTAGTVTAALTGNVTGNVTGTLTGNASTATTLTGVLAKSLGGTAQDNSTLTFPSSGTIPAVTPTNHGVVISGAGAAATVTVAGTTGQILTGVTGGDPTFQAAPVSTTLTTKGDLQGYSTVNARVPAGTNGQRLIADSNNANGVRYSDIQPKNYLQVSADAEVDTSGWVTYFDAAGNKPVDCTGGTATSLTFSRSTSSPLRGTGSFSMVQANSTSLQGKGVSADFTIDSADQAKMLSVSYDYNASSTFIPGNGTTAPLNDGTTTTNAGNSDIETFIYDVTNAVLIPVTPQVVTANGANNFTFKGVFQTASNSTSYRICQHVATTSANATGWTFKYDNVYVGPQPIVQGAPATDWVSYTPTTAGFGTPTISLAQYRRVGDSIQIQAAITLGTTTATLAQFGLPAGFTVGSAVTQTTSVAAFATDTSVATTFYTNINASNSTFLTFGRQDGSNAGITNANGSTLFGTGQKISFTTGFIPINGLSSTVQMSNDTDTRVVAAQYYCATNNTISSALPGQFNTKVFDTHNAVTTGSAWKYTVPVSGYYEVSAYLNMAGSSGTVSIYKNGADAIDLVNTSASFYQVGGVVSVVAGDYLDIRSASSTTLNSGATLANNPSWISIKRLSGPSAIAATESVNARYYSSATSLSGTQAVVNFATKDYDSHNAYSAGTYTIPVSGKYQINTLMGIAGTYTTGQNIHLSIFKNGSAVSDAFFLYAATSTNAASMNDVISFVAGDTMTIKVSSSATSPTFEAGNRVYMSIARVGN